MKNTCAVILAAGKGTRMKSKKPKVLVEVLFKPMLGYVADACVEAGIETLCAVTGYKAGEVSEYLDNRYGSRVQTVLQEQQMGTGHAVMMAREYLQSHRGEDVCVLCGDSPCLTGEVLQEAYRQHKAEGNAITIVTAKLEQPFGYGRIIRKSGEVLKIVEQKDTNEAEDNVTEVNSGTYWFSVDNLLDQLASLTADNAQGEYYLTDTVDLTIKSGRRVGAYRSPESDIVLGVNSRKELLGLNEMLCRKKIQQLMVDGVEFITTDGVVICPDVEVGSDTVIYGGTVLKHRVSIGEDCIIGPNTLLDHCEVGDRVKLNETQGYWAKIHSDADVGPYVHIRPNSEIKSFVHIGDFVEVKNSVVGEGTGISHLTYVGDSDVGQNVNFGCGVVTVNYDGVNKNRCVIEDEAFIGCNTNLVAPVRVGKGAYTAAGSTITGDVPDKALGIARARQVNKEGFAERKLKGRKIKFKNK